MNELEPWELRKIVEALESYVITMEEYGHMMDEGKQKRAIKCIGGIKTKIEKMLGVAEKEEPKEVKRWDAPDRFSW